MVDMKQSASGARERQAGQFERNADLEKLVQEASKGSWSNRSTSRPYPGQDMYVPTYVSAGSR